MRTKTSLLVLGLFSVLLLAMSVVATGQASVSCTGVIAWAAGGNYTVGELVTYEGSEYKCLQANNDAAPNWDPIDWPAGWSLVGTCSSGGATATATKTATSVGTATKTATKTATATATKTATATATKTATPCQTNCSAASFIFSQYKDVTVDTNWNTDELMSTVMGTSEPVTTAMPNKTLTWAFATGTCGSESWAGITPAEMASNVPIFTAAGKDYIPSTGGADGSFDCPSSSAFASFIQTYYSANMVGVDFDIEVGQSQAIVDDLINAVKGVEGTYPSMRFSFTIASLGGSANPILGTEGVLVVNQIKSLGLGGTIPSTRWRSITARPLPAIACYRAAFAKWANRPFKQWSRSARSTAFRMATSKSR